MPDAKRSRFKISDSTGGRVNEGEADAAVLIADGMVHAATDVEGAWTQWLALTEFLAQHMPPSARWQALHIATAHARAAVQGDARAKVDARCMTSAASMLSLARDVLGEDAHAKLRKAAADRMLGR